MQKKREYEIHIPILVFEDFTPYPSLTICYNALWFRPTCFSDCVA